MQRHVGQSFPVLVENDVNIINEQPVRFGYSPNYLRTAIPVSNDTPCANSIMLAHAKHYDAATAILLAETVEN